VFGRLDLRPETKAEIGMVVEVQIERLAGISASYRFIQPLEASR
jgi:hypothetical protein